MIHKKHTKYQEEEVIQDIKQVEDTKVLGY